MIYFIVMHLLKNDILIEYFTFVFNVDEGEITKHFHFFFQDKFRFSHTRWFYKVYFTMKVHIDTLICMKIISKFNYVGNKPFSSLIGIVSIYSNWRTNTLFLYSYS